MRTDIKDILAEGNWIKWNNGPNPIKRDEIFSVIFVDEVEAGYTDDWAAGAPLDSTFSQFFDWENKNDGKGAIGYYRLFTEKEAYEYHYRGS